MKRIRILIVDDHSVVRMGLAALLDTIPDFVVAGEAANGSEAIRLAKATHPDVVLMDLMMPGIGGLTATESLLKLDTPPAVLILTTFSEPSDISRALPLGARGALLKSSSNEELATAIHAVAAGKRFVSREVTRLLREDPAPPQLTHRQLEILTYVTRGLTNPDIARLLNIRTDSVGAHLTGIFERLGAANRSEAVAIALRKHLLKS